ncbi:MAG: transglycosylase SLT domain-containing protein [Alphaproteobacteria bacterium]|nr:transglycosylase SLT domain-containing protein [Alphaproteobacteria bacterium]
MNLINAIKWPSVIVLIALYLWVGLLPVKAHAASAGANSLLGTLPPEKIHGAQDGVFLCEEAIAFAEKSMGIPSQLLHAIALGESGRGLPKNISQSERSISGMTLWPWTVMAEGKGRYLKNKFEALKEVKKLKTKGVTNIDIGCMQINLHYHGKAFQNIEEGFNPIHNVAYAAIFLKNLRERHGSWTKAVKYYHSGNPEKHIPYAKKIIGLWQKLKREGMKNRKAVKLTQNSPATSNPSLFQKAQ